MMKMLRHILDMPLQFVITTGIKAVLLDGLVSFLFYRSVIAFILLLPMGFIYIYKKSFIYEERIKSEYRQQFKDGINSVSASLAAGYSIENSFSEAKKEMELLYGEDAFIVKEFGIILGKVNVNQTIESAIDEMAQKSGIEEMCNFAEVFKFAKRSGGDLVRIIKDTADNISERQEVINEIEVMLQGKRYEQSIMNVVPFIIILYLNITMPTMLQPMYGNLFGIFVMTVALVLYVAAVALSERIIDIEV